MTLKGGFIDYLKVQIPFVLSKRLCKSGDYFGSVFLEISTNGPILIGLHYAISEGHYSALSYLTGFCLFLKSGLNHFFYRNSFDEDNNDGDDDSDPPTPLPRNPLTNTNNLEQYISV